MITLLPSVAHAQLRISLESGAAFSQYNDVQAPNGDDPGTRFSLHDDFTPQPTVFFRAELSYLIADRHTIELTAAPLTLEYEDAQPDLINFENTNFVGGGADGVYQFNTYRASYRYRILKRPAWTIDLGATLLVRDAKIELSQGAFGERNTDLGFVPLVSFLVQYDPSDHVSLLLKGDALVGGAGRAEDVFGGILVSLAGDWLDLKVGYRLIEGGADVDQVYNFAFIHFASAGVVAEF